MIISAFAEGRLAVYFSPMPQRWIVKKLNRGMFGFEVITDHSLHLYFRCFLPGALIQSVITE